MSRRGGIVRCRLGPFLDYYGLCFRRDRCGRYGHGTVFPDFFDRGRLYRFLLLMLLKITFNQRFNINRQVFGLRPKFKMKSVLPISVGLRKPSSLFVEI